MTVVSATAAKEDMHITEDMEAEPLEAEDLNEMAIKIGSIATKNNKSNSKGTRSGEEGVSEQSSKQSENKMRADQSKAGDPKTKKKRGEGEKRPCPARFKRYSYTHTQHIFEIL